MNKGDDNRPRPRPPKGFKTWLDYAVVTMDDRSAWLYQPNVREHWTRGHMRIAVADELRHLRALAGVPDTLRPDDPEDLAGLESVALPAVRRRWRTKAEVDAYLEKHKDAPGYTMVRALMYADIEEPPKKSPAKAPKKTP